MRKFLSLTAALLTVSLALIGCGKTEVPESEGNSLTDSVPAADVTSAAEEDNTSLAETEPESTPLPETEAKTAAQPETEAPTEEDFVNINDTDDAYVDYYFRTEKQLNQHFEKHGGEFGEEFGYETAEDYELGASDVINDPNALFKLEAEDGDVVYYIEDTNEFVILSDDGYIRTYFRPSAGKDYFDRQ